MIHVLSIFQGIVERGLLFSIVTFSVFISSRFLHFDNLSVEGAFGLGGAVTALLLHYGYTPLVTLLAGTLTGAVTGIATAALARKLKLNALISGIVVTTGLFSITLVTAGSNMVVAGCKTIFKNGLMPSSGIQTLVVLCICVLALMLTLGWFLQTEVGFLLRSVGEAPQMLINVGKNVDGYVTFGLCLSNALAGLAGGLFVHYTGYFSIWSNVGILIIGLAGMILAEMIDKQFGFALILGSLCYQALIALTFELQISQEWNKLITALLIVALIVLRDYFKQRTHHVGS